MKITSTRRLFLGGTAAIGSAAALAACGGQQSAEEQQQQAEEENAKAAEEQSELPSTAWERAEYDQVADGGTLTLSVSQLPNNWNSQQTDGNLADLTKIREPMGDGAEITYSETGEKAFNPDYVESAELTSEDPQIVTFKYNKDAVWDNGDPIVVEDLIANWKATSGEDEDFLIVTSVGWDQIKEIRQTDDEFTGEIEFAEPFADWITLVHPDSPASVTSDAKAFNEGYVSEPTPSKGPFTVSDIDSSGGVVTLTPNEKWWGRAPKLEKIVYKVTDQSQAPAAFANGELDIYEIANGDELAQAKGRSDASIQVTNGLTWTHLTLNTEGGDGCLADAKVREAIARGIDRNAIGNAVVGPLEAPIVLTNNFVYMPGQEGYEDSYEPLGGLEFDAEAAKKLLDDAGWVAASEGEVREKDGKKLAFTIIVPADTKSNEDRAAQVLTNLNAIGFEVKVQTVPSDAYFDEYITPKNFDAVTFSWVGSQYPESSSVNLVYPKDSGQNFTNFEDERLGDLNNQLKAAFDDEEKKKLANEVSKIIAESFTVIPFYATPEIWGVKDGVVNYGASQFEVSDWTQVGLKA